VKITAFRHSEAMYSGITGSGREVCRFLNQLSLSQSQVFIPGPVVLNVSGRGGGGENVLPLSSWYETAPGVGRTG
jgi:hypothetical protein